MSDKSNERGVEWSIEARKLQADLKIAVEALEKIIKQSCTGSAFDTQAIRNRRLDKIENLSKSVLSKLSVKKS